MRRFITRKTFLIVAIIGGVLTVAWIRSQFAPQPVDEERHELVMPPIASSRFKNVVAEARFIGSDTCKDCHTAEHQSYDHTPHSRALSIVTPEENIDVSFQHPHSGRAYRVYLDGKSMRHRESMVLADGEELVLADHVVRFAIGSGRNWRTYLIQKDGFVSESPISWYATKQGWDMSPGYADKTVGFERMVDPSCLSCHAGHVERLDDSFHRVRIHEHAIGCERCHGPGSLHAARWNATTPIDDASSDEVDLTIVNPKRLPRVRREAICAQCHLRGAATVDVTGRSRFDYRPSQRLTDFRVDFGFESPEDMKVVGHIEQMRLSLCYQSSKTMTCTTCHDPHADVAANERMEFFRSKCLECHVLGDCKSPKEQRASKLDNCSVCHMPQVPISIPHLTFTHHRIGLHSSQTSQSQKDNITQTLVPIGDVSHLPQAELARCLGLAYLEISDRQTSPDLFHEYRRRAKALLETTAQQREPDSEVSAALAQLFWERDPHASIKHAKLALNVPGISPPARVNALFALASSQYRTQNPAVAVTALEELVKYRRFAEDWVLLGVSREQTADLDLKQASAEREFAIFGSAAGRDRPGGGTGIWRAAIL